LLIGAYCPEDENFNDTTAKPGFILSSEALSGRLAVWFNYRPDGSVEPAALHKSLAVKGGAKATITNFIYKTIGGFNEMRAAPPLLRTAPLDSPAPR
jgi:hypothetical protein